MDRKNTVPGVFRYYIKPKRRIRWCYLTLGVVEVVTFNTYLNSLIFLLYGEFSVHSKSVRKENPAVKKL